MRYLSVCSGIEAASVAWQGLGWEAVAFAEIEAFPSAVLAYHYPDVPNVGDMTQIDGTNYCGLVNVLVGGTPCQSFSVAGLRRGLDDERGNLALEFVRLADECDPAFIVWENVPGVLSDRGNAFGCFLAALSGEDAPLLPAGGKWTDAGYVLGTCRAIAWRILDAQYFGLAQRRRRVFVVGCPRNGADPRKILFEFDGMRRDFAPGRKAGPDVTGTFTASAYAGGAGDRPEKAAAGHFVTQALTGSLGNGGPDDNRAQGGFYVPTVHKGLSHFEGGPHPCLNQSAKGSGGIGMSDQELFSQQGSGLTLYCPQIVPQAMSCKWSKGTSGPAGDEHHNLVAATQYGEVAATLTNRNDGSPCHDREPTIVAFHGSQDPSVSGDVTHPCGRNNGLETCITYSVRTSQTGSNGWGIQDNVAHTLDQTSGPAVMAFAQNQLGEIRVGDISSTLNRNGNASGRNAPLMYAHSAVRRLTPRECERLQGFPDDYTAIPYRGKPATDGPRYKALGNSMAVPVMRWIGERIARYA